MEHNGQVCGYNHTKNTREYFRGTPKWAKYQLEGNNLIGNPSVITFRTEITEFFDDNVDLFMDTDFYQRLYSSFGLPKIIDKTIVSIREHDDRVSANTKYDGQFSNPEDGTSWLINKEEIEYFGISMVNQMKDNLKDVTFIIPVRIESDDRLRNVITSLCYLNTVFDTNFIIHEHDKESIFFYFKNQPQIEEYCEGDIILIFIIPLFKLMNHCFIDKKFSMIC